MGQKETSRYEGPKFSNALRLSLREWVGLGIFTAALVVFAPAVWKQAEPLPLEPDYRVPYDLSNDYWLYDRYARLAAAHYDTVLVGDSVVWGQYVTRQGTLSHYLNRKAGREGFANLGLDGAHPAALAGLVEYYGAGITGKDVVVQCNPLWISSPRHDLQEDQEFHFNHPQLVPQFVPWIPCYRESASNRIGNVIDREVPFTGWANHLQQTYFERMSIPGWTMDHPYDNAAEPLTRGLPPSDNTLRHEPVSWTARGIKRQNFPWVDPETSFQWHSFRRAVTILRRRGNRVFVLVGPFNEHMLTPPSLQAYRDVQQAIAAWLRENGVDYAVPKALPSPLYADASHPLAAGYELLARRLAELPFFQPQGAPR
jgi:hypothetical protein